MLTATDKTMTGEQLQSIFDRIKKFAGGHELEVIISGGRSALTRFANNMIHQNVAEEGTVISVRVAFEGKTARATTNKTDDESLRRAVQSAQELTRMQASDPELLPMTRQLPPVVSNPPSRFFEETAGVTPEDRAACVSKIVDVAKKHKLVTAGIFSTSDSFESIFNS